jgi:hypothetical protein
MQLRIWSWYASVNCVRILSAHSDNDFKADRSTADAKNTAKMAFNNRCWFVLFLRNQKGVSLCAPIAATISATDRAGLPCWIWADRAGL